MKLKLIIAATLLMVATMSANAVVLTQYSPGGAIVMNPADC